MVDSSRHRCWYGTGEPPPTLLEVQAGPVSAILDGVELRYVHYGEREIVRRIYPSVRDADWKVVPIEVLDESCSIDDDRFSIEFRAAHALNEILYEWDGAIHGTPDGSLVYTMRGTALSDFAYNRIGFVILHPELEYAGRPYRCRRSPESTWSTGFLPERIAPQVHDPNGRYIATTPWLNELAVELDDALEVRFDLQGELFEMEDQRNWDNSLKTFCTPLSVDYPHRAKAGDTRSISVTASVASRGGTMPPRRRATRRRVVTLGEARGGVLPPIGFGLKKRERPLSAVELERLRLTRPDHLRVELHLGDPQHVATLEQALGTCGQLDCGLELCLHADLGDTSALDRLGDRLVGERVARVLVWQEGGYAPFLADTTPYALLRLVQERLSGCGVQPSIAYGSEVGFAQVNKVRPDLTRCDALYFAYYALVHTGDNLSFCETFPTQREMIRSTRAFAGSLPIAVSPITFTARRNYYVPPTREHDDFDQLPEAGGLPRAVDPRQMSLFGAGWTVGTIEAFSAADSLTLYETTGWRGLMEDTDGPALPELFPSRPGMVFPLFYVFADLAGWKRCELAGCRPSHPRETTALALIRGKDVLILIANLTAVDQTVELEGDIAGAASVRMLDDSSVTEWSSNPSAFHVRGEDVLVNDGRLTLGIRPYGVARVVASRSSRVR